MNITAKELKQIVARQRHKPCNFSNTFLHKGIEFFYHSETEPHDHKSQTENKVWEVEFFYFKRDYVFVFYQNGRKREVTPKKGERIRFDCLRRHAVLKKSHADKFSARKYWNGLFGGETVNGELVCIFRFTH